MYTSTAAQYPIAQCVDVIEPNRVT